MNQFLKTTTDTEQWLQSMNISDYDIVPDQSLGLVVNVSKSVNLSSQGLTYIPVQFGEVMGGFYCDHNQLKSFLGSPHTLGGGFYANHNQATSLLGAPTHVGEFFSCDFNQLTSLSYAPKEIEEVFTCSHNRLTSLLGGPQKVYGNFWCNNNQLTNLEGAPRNIEGDFFASHNALETLFFFPNHVNNSCYLDNNPLLGEAQNITDFQTIFEIHQCWAEKSLLSKAVTQPSNKTGLPYKI